MDTAKISNTLWSEGNFGINSIQIFPSKICRKPGSWIEPVIFSHLKTGDPVTVKTVGFVNKCRHAGFSCDHVKKVFGGGRIQTKKKKVKNWQWKGDEKLKCYHFYWKIKFVNEKSLVKQKNKFR